MKQVLVLLENKKAITTTRIIADGCSVEHKAIIQLVKKYAKDINDVGSSPFKMRNFKTAGRPGEEIILDEQQTTFLITLMRNSKITVAFKKKLTQAFFKMRTALANLASQRHDPAWLDMRKDGKISQRRKTDTIKRFVEYATQQGSKSANKYYMVLAKMENSALFFLEQRFKNVREVLIIRQLMIVSMADDVVEKALQDGMNENLSYKDCYNLAKDRIITFAKLACRSPVLSLGLKRHKGEEEVNAHARNDD